MGHGGCSRNPKFLSHRPNRRRILHKKSRIGSPPSSHQRLRRKSQSKSHRARFSRLTRSRLLLPRRVEGTERNG